MAPSTSKKYPYTMQPHTVSKPPFTVEAPGFAPVKGETLPRRTPVAKDKLFSHPEEGVTTIYDLLTRGSEKFGNAKLVGTRDLINTHIETKKIKKMVDGKEQEVEKKWTYYELSEYHYLSFIEYERLTLQIGAGLRQLGMQKEDRVHIFAGTR
jgi:long-chain acyl-CoA synthetase